MQYVIRVVFETGYNPVCKDASKTSDNNRWSRLVGPENDPFVYDNINMAHSTCQSYNSNATPYCYDRYYLVEEYSK